MILTEPDCPSALADPDIFAGDHFAIGDDMVSPAQHGGAEGFVEADDFHWFGFLLVRFYAPGRSIMEKLEVRAAMRRNLSVTRERRRIAESIAGRVGQRKVREKRFKGLSSAKAGRDRTSSALRIIQNSSGLAQ